MKKTCNIWIPSIQSFIRFFALSTDQYKTILNTLFDSDIDFIHVLNSVIEANIIEYADYQKLTTIDRFIIFLALKIHSCSPQIVLSTKCAKCETTSTIKMNLNTLIDNLAIRIDKSFNKVIPFNQYVVLCDIPTIKTDYIIHEHSLLHNIEFSSTENNINNHILTYIKEIMINDTRIDVDDLEYRDKIQVVDKLPAKLIINIYDSFLRDIHSLVSDFDFLKIQCTGKKCDNITEVKFDIGNINDIIKIIYKDQSMESLLIEMANVSSQTYLGGSYLSSITPMELHFLSDSVKKAEKENDSPPPPPKEKDLFEEYREQTQGMKESTSEFASM